MWRGLFTHQEAQKEIIFIRTMPFSDCECVWKCSQWSDIFVNSWNKFVFLYHRECCTHSNMSLMGWLTQKAANHIGCGTEWLSFEHTLLVITPTHRQTCTHMLLTIVVSNPLPSLRALTITVSITFPTFIPRLHKHQHYSNVLLDDHSYNKLLYVGW